MLKRTFDLLVKMRWLKMIDKECNKYTKLKLIEAYLKVYDEDLRKPQEMVGEDNV